MVELSVNSGSLRHSDEQKNAISTGSLRTLVEFVRVVARIRASMVRSREHSNRTPVDELLYRGRKTFGSGEADASIIEDRIQKARFLAGVGGQS